MVLRFYTKLCQILSHSAKILKCGCTKKNFTQKKSAGPLKKFWNLCKKKVNLWPDGQFASKVETVATKLQLLKLMSHSIQTSCLISCKSSSCHLWPLKARIRHLWECHGTLAVKPLGHLFECVLDLFCVCDGFFFLLPKTLWVSWYVAVSISLLR